MLQAAEEKARDEVIDEIAARVQQRWRAEQAEIVATSVGLVLRRGGASRDALEPAQRRPLTARALSHWNVGEARAARREIRVRAG
ncbi:MAG: hypothetical protein U5L11_10335 [Arhodomonas sp.]|nr:hypothetical protein [Arhodomonas sp.]